MRQAAAVLLCVLTLAITPARGRSQGASTGVNWAPTVTMVASPAAPDSAQPQLSALGDRVVLSWVERSGDKATLRFSDRTDTGWTEAQTAILPAPLPNSWSNRWASAISTSSRQAESFIASN